MQACLLGAMAALRVRPGPIESIGGGSLLPVSRPAQAGHPRLRGWQRHKTRVAGPSPAMTQCLAARTRPSRSYG